MADKHKTKAEILQELESIKGLLLEEDQIPILQDMETYEWHPEPAAKPAAAPLSSIQETKKPGFAANLPPLHSSPQTANPTRPLAKASGENPFLPQHIRARLHGNNPPPLFEYETAKKIISATKNIAHKVNKPRQHLVDEVIQALVPQIESELRQKLFAMSVEELEQLLNEDEDL